MIHEVIGVVAAIRDTRDVTPRDRVYLDRATDSSPGLNIHVAGTLPAAELLRILREQIRAVDHRVVVLRAMTLENFAKRLGYSMRLGATASGFFGLISLLIAGLGAVSVVEHVLSARAREVGIRLALGAPRLGILRTITSRGLAMLVLGTVLGSCFAFWSTSTFSSYLYQVPARDPRAFAAAALTVLGFGSVVCTIPVLRLLRSNPFEVLKSE
jgi:ABC-type antimicrobial peptide transport system permease subunit